MKLCVLTLFTALLLSTAGSSSGAAPLAVPSYSVTLPGVRPTPPDTGSYLEVPYSAALNPAGGALTIEGWVKRDAVSRHETLIGNGWRLSYWLGFSATGKLSFTPHGSDGVVDGSATIPAGVWTHVAVTYDGSVRRYFINGVLDTTSNENPGPLVAAAPSQPLDIGYDRDGDFTPNFYGGGIDNLRLWNVVRDAGQIRDAMYLSYGAPEPGLLAEWSFDGATTDPVGGHTAISYGAAVFSNEGAIPHDVSIPKSIGTHTLDGQCDVSGEYGNALQLTLDGSALWLAHTATDLWVCAQMAAFPAPVSMSVYLDPAYTRLDPAQPDHVRLTVADDGSLKAEVGTGEGGYAPTTAFDKQWAGIWSEPVGSVPVAEFRISNKILGGWDRVIGLAVERITDLFGRPVQRFWPALAAEELPGTWSSATLEGTSAARTFQGRVVYQPPVDGSKALGVAGVRVDLIGNNPDGSEALVQTTRSGPNGQFSLTGRDAYAGHRLELGPLPAGYFPLAAQAGMASPSADPHSLDYGTSPGGAYLENNFSMGAQPGLQMPMPLERGPYYLIITSQAIKNSGALDEYVAFKRRMGFSVEVKSIEGIATTYPGATLRDKIRSLEIERWDAPAFGERFRYLLLVGTDSVIPFTRFAIYFNGKDGELHVDPDACAAGPNPASEDANLEGLGIKWTDWPYADLHSDFDSNGNGCLLDGILMADNTTSPAPGYVPDVLPALWWADVAVGRIPFDDAAIVETVLANSMGAERQSQDYKRHILSAMSYTHLQGQYWHPKDTPVSGGGAYYPCPGADASSDRCQGSTEDMAYVSENARSAFLEPLGYSLTTLYEGVKAPGANPAVPNVALTEANVVAELADQRYGMVNLAGHGSAEGVGRTFWNNLNNNATVDSPTAPIGGISQNEITKTLLLSRLDLGPLPPANQHRAIYNVSACSSGCPLPLCSPSFGATVLQSGAGIAWVGGLNRTSSTMQAGLMERLFVGDRRLGDALWETLAQSANDDFSGSAEFSTQLYGDPTLSYWGNPGGQVTLAAWPMLRYNAIGQGYSPLPGPAAAHTLWSYAGAAPGGGTLQPSPIAGNNGEVIVADGTHLDVLRNGEPHQQLALDAPAFGTPALAADGTLYALDTGGHLYAFAYHEYPGPNPWDRYLRWKDYLLAPPTTSPVVGADGLIAVGVEGKVVLVRPYGSIARSYDVAGDPVGELAYGADRTLYAATTAGSVYLIPFGSDEECGDCRIHGGSRDSPPNSTPPLVAWGKVYVGRADGSVILLDATTLEQEQVFDCGGAVVAGPIAAPGGLVVVGTTDGEVYSLDRNTLALRWAILSGTALSASAPASSADAVYIVLGGYLEARSPASGAPLWSRWLGSGILAGSVAVGPGRELYVQADNGKVVGLGEGGWAPLFGVAQTSVIADTGIRGIQVSWQSGGAAPAGSPGTLLQRSTPDGAWHDLAVLPSGATIYTDTNVLDNRVYAYRVQVLDAGGRDSDFSISLDTVRSLPAAPHAPSLSAVADPTAGSLRLTWSPAPGAVVDAYRIERSLFAGGPFSPALQVGGQVTTTVDSGLAPGTTYHYRVVAANATGESAPSNVRSGATRRRTLAAPTDVTAALLRDGAVEIGWHAGPVGATAVIETMQLGMDDYAPLASVGAAGPYRYNAGEPGTFRYRLKFVQGDDESEYTETVLVWVMPPRLHLPLVMR